MCCCLTSPKLISDVSSSESDMKTENRPFLRTAPVCMRSMKLKAPACDIAGKPRPNTPSKWNALKGLSLSYVARMKDASVQTLPKQIRSLAQRPHTSPVPKVMVTSSEGAAAPGVGGVPSHPTSCNDDELFWLNRRCSRHASLSQSSTGISRLPLPVSNTTEKACGGVPMCIVPKYALLWTALLCCRPPASAPACWTKATLRWSGKVVESSPIAVCKNSRLKTSAAEARRSTKTIAISDQ
mmetsp:Transcript_125425/g.360377  ORF Transcript_125425/g.360377 Transcript_125425/m.360377 type:complete len:240 (+) Transcript_125425:622-1341(+)